MLGNELVSMAATMLLMGCSPPEPVTPIDAALPVAASPADAAHSSVSVVGPTTVAAAAIPLAPVAGSPAAFTADAALEGAEPGGLVGEYRYHSGKESVRTAIDAVVAEMNVLVRRIARRRLVAANAVPKRIAIRQDGDVVTVEIDGRGYSAPLGGGGRKVRDPNGEASTMRLAMQGDALYQTFHADQGDRINVFSARKSGGVTMSVRITSPKLPSDVRYQLVFAAQ